MGLESRQKHHSNPGRQFLSLTTPPGPPIVCFVLGFVFSRCIALKERRQCVTQVILRMRPLLGDARHDPVNGVGPNNRKIHQAPKAKRINNGRHRTMIYKYRTVGSYKEEASETGSESE